MNKKLSSLIIEKGGAPYHITWATYFMMDAFDLTLQEDKNNFSSPTIAFVSTIHYTPISNQDMYNSLSNFEINEKNNINDFFRSIFKADKFNLTETAILAQMARNECKEGIKNANENYIMQYVFRGFIILILTFPMYFTEYIDEKTSKSKEITEKKSKTNNNDHKRIEEKFDWKLMSFIINYLSNSNNGVHDAFLQSFEPLITPYSKIQSLLILSHDSPLFLFLLEIVQTIITFSGRFCQLKLHSELDFVNSFFLFHLTTIKNNSNSIIKEKNNNTSSSTNYYTFTSENPIVQYFSVFIQFLISFQCKNVTIRLSNSLRITISTFLACFQDCQFCDENLFLEGTESILVTSYLNTEKSDDPPTTLLFCQGIMTFINWACKVYQFDEVFKDISSFEEKPELRSSEMPQNYFVTHRGVELHNKFTVSKTPKQCVQFAKLIQTLKTTLLNFSNIDFFIQSINTFFNHISDLSLVILLISFPFPSVKRFDDCLANFLKCLLSSDIFDVSKINVLEGLNVALFDYSLNIFLNLFEIYPSYRSDILNFIFENLEFRNFLRILPLFRSLLLINSQTYFISELIKTNFFEILDCFLDKSEYQREVDACVAFIQICVCTEPVLTMSSYNLIIFLFKCLPKENYKAKVLKCFRLALAQKSTDAIVLLSIQIRNMIRQSIETKANYELSSELIDILSQNLNSFSIQIIEKLESESIFDLIARLPYSISNRDCLLNVLKFFMILFSKFPSMNEILVRKNIYENLMNALNIIPIDDEVLITLLSLIMENEVDLNDKGMNLMMNLSALKYVNEIMKKSTNDNKMKYLNFLVNHCIKNAANCFFCFQSGVLDLTLDCLEIESLHDISLNLFKIISSLFFSTRDLRSCARTLSKYLDDDNNTHKKEICLLFEKLNEMLNETCYDNATSFFHFSSLSANKITAEVLQDLSVNDSNNNNSFTENSNLSLFAKSWVFSSTFSISDFHNKMIVFSIKSIQQQQMQNQHSKFIKTSRHRSIIGRTSSQVSKSHQLKQEPKQITSFIDCYFESNNLVVQLNNKESKKFKFSFVSPYWYSICIYFKGKEVSLFIDQKYIETIKFSQNISYQGEYEITIGGHFYGDIGDISIYEAPTIKENNFSELTNLNENSSLQFYPRNIDPHTKMLTNTRTTNCTINCYYVPFRTTFKRCIISSITFSLFLPLINQINDSDVLNLFLKFIQSLFNCSKENETYFEKVNGFQLFTGLIKNFEKFNDKSCDYLFNLYKSIQTESLKNQMIEYLFLRFDLIFKFNDSFITKYFEKTILDLFSLDKEKFYHFKSMFDQMIYSTCEYSIDTKKKIDKINPKHIEKVFDFFYELFNSNVSIEKPIHNLFLIYLFSKDSKLKSVILNTINKYIVTRKDQIICMLPEFKYFERFYSSIYSEDENEQKSALKLFTSLIQLERSKEINTQTLIKVISYIQKNKTLSKNTTKIAINSKNEVKYPELVTVFCSGFPYSNDKVSLSKKFQETIERKTIDTFFTNEFSPFFMLCYCINDVDLWNTFTPIFIENPDLLQKTLFTLNFFSLFVNNDCSPIKKRIFINVMKMALQKQPKTIKTIADVAVQFYSYRFYNHNSTNGAVRYIDNVSFEQIQKFMEWILTPESINQLFSYNANLLEDEDYCYTLYQVLSDIVSKTQGRKSGKESEIQITSEDSYSTFSIICVLISYIIENSSNSILKDSMVNFFEKVAVRKEKEHVNQIYYSLKKAKLNADSFHQKFPDAESDNSLKENFLIFIEDSKMTFKFDWQSPFNRFIKNAQQVFDKDPISNINTSNYESFVQTSEEKIEFIENYCKNLSLSFIRESKFIDSKGTLDSKFRISNEVDMLGRRCYMTLNKYFSDHRTASENREDGTFPEDDQKVEDDQPTNITEIKRFLDRSVQQSISNIQYSNDIQKALLITLTGRYDVFYQFDQSSVVIGGKLAFNGFGSEINQPSPLENDVNQRSKEMVAEEKAINNNSAPLKYIRIYFKDVLFIFNRRFLHEQTGCEIFSSNRKSYLLNFSSTQQRNFFCTRFKCPENVPKSSIKNKELKRPYNFFTELRRATNGLYQSISSAELFTRSRVAEAWLNRLLSNYQYLYYLNILSGRSFNDTSQYPVYPWIIQKYDTNTIDIYDRSIYRDLSIPIAAYDKKRLFECQQKLSDSFDPIEKCMFRSFYSNSAIVTHFLIRSEPFTSLHILLQSGRFDYADRLFKSIESSFISSTTGSCDFSELLPEFFTNWHFLVNENGFDLGRLQTGQLVSDVILPKWARNACHFVETNRIALESEYVRCHLNEWIDLIFGCYQKSIEKNNLFHLFNYSDCIYNPEVTNNDLLSLAKHHAMNFGCSPEKLLNDNHPVMHQNINLMFPSVPSLENTSDPFIIPQKQPSVPFRTSSSSIASSSSALFTKSHKLAMTSKETFKLNEVSTFDAHCLNNDPVLVDKLTHEISSYDESRYSKLMTKSFSNDNITSEIVNQNTLPRAKPDLPDENIVFFSDMYYLTELGNFGKVDSSNLRNKYKNQRATTGHENYVESKNYGYITNIFGNNRSKAENSSNNTSNASPNKNIPLNQVSDSLSDRDSQGSIDSSSNFFFTDSDSKMPPFSATNSQMKSGLRKLIVQKNSHTVFLKKSKIFVYIQANGSCAVAVPLYKSSFVFNGCSDDSSPVSAPNSHKLIMHESSPISCICGISDSIIVTGGSDCCLNVWMPPFDSDSMRSIPILSQKLVSVSGNATLDRIVTIDESSQIFITSLSKKKLLFSFNLAEIFERERRKNAREGMRRRKSSSLTPKTPKLAPAAATTATRIELKRNTSRSSFDSSEGTIESSHDEFDIESSHDEFDIESSGDELDVDSDENEETASSKKKKSSIQSDNDNGDTESEYEYSESSHDELDFDSDQNTSQFSTPSDSNVDQCNSNNGRDKLINSSILCDTNNNGDTYCANMSGADAYQRKLSNHQILLLENSLILTACVNADDGETRIDLFDLTGKRVSAPISFDGEIMKMIQAKNQNEIYVILSMSTHHIYIINCHAFDVSVKCIGNYPELVCLTEKGDALAVSDSFKHLTIYDLCSK